MMATGRQPQGAAESGERTTRIGAARLRAGPVRRRSGEIATDPARYLGPDASAGSTENFTVSVAPPAKVSVTGTLSPGLIARVAWVSIR